MAVLTEGPTPNATAVYDCGVQVDAVRSRLVPLAKDVRLVAPQMSEVVRYERFGQRQIPRSEYMYGRASHAYGASESGRRGRRLSMSISAFPEAVAMRAHI